MRGGGRMLFEMQDPAVLGHARRPDFVVQSNLISHAGFFVRKQKAGFCGLLVLHRHLIARTQQHDHQSGRAAERYGHPAQPRKIFSSGPMSGPAGRVANQLKAGAAVWRKCLMHGVALCLRLSFFLKTRALGIESRLVRCRAVGRPLAWLFIIRLQTESKSTFEG
ncbi:hypothetical protein VTK56DRAFT_6773 [Thermocarpiscus australiensis]